MMTQQQKDELLRKHGRGGTGGTDVSSIMENAPTPVNTSNSNTSNVDSAWSQFLAKEKLDTPPQGATLDLNDLNKQLSSSVVKENVGEKKGFFSDLWGDIKQTGGAMFEDVKKRGTQIVEDINEDTGEDLGLIGNIKQGFHQGLRAAGQVAGGIGDILGDAIVGAAKISATQGDEETIKSGVKSLGESFLQTPAGKSFAELASGKIEDYKAWKEANPEKARDLEDVANIASLFPLEKLLGAGVKAGGKLVEKGVEGVGDLTKKVVEEAPKLATKVAESGIGKKVTSLFPKSTKTVEDAISQADTALKNLPETAKTSTTLKLAEQAAPKVSLREKWGGVRPDIKKRISGKVDQLKQYFDVSHARNLNDTLPTPLEYAAKQVEKVKNKLGEVLNDTGSAIGKFRQKIGTYFATNDDFNTIRNSFDDSIKKLNLAVKNNAISRMKGKVAGLVSESEVKLIQSLRDDVMRVSQSPTVKNLIELRNALDKKINFAKMSKEASNVIDPLARDVRKVIAEVNRKLVGKSEAGNIEKYSDLIGLFDEISSAVDSKSGAEFILKRILSERGRIPRELFDELKKVTGIDLMDDATMAQLATEIIGNSAQKGLFRQEITKAGLDAMDVIDLISGAPGGAKRAVETLLEKGKGMISKPEKMFLKAAGEGKKKSPNYVKISPKLAKFTKLEKVGIKELNEMIASKGITESEKNALKQIKQEVELLKKEFTGSDIESKVTKKLDDFTDVSKVDDTLIKEAKKYKSAEEFVRSNKPIYHGTPESFIEFDVNKMEGGQAWFTTSKADITSGTAGAVQGKGQKLNIMERYIKPGLKFADEKTSDKYYTDELISQGYAGKKVEQDGATWYSLFEPNKDLQTKSQLTDIWNKANKKTPN